MDMNFREKVILGRTGLEVSRLGIASGYGVEAAAIEKAYHESGINYFYWSTPRKPGMRTALKNLASTQRDKMVIVFQSYDRSGLMMKSGVEKGLRELGIDYVDILLLGWFNHKPSQRLLNKVFQLRDAGMVRYIAMSGHNRKTFGMLAQDPNSAIDVFMSRYNAVHTGAEQDIFPFVGTTGQPGITIYTATCWGKLLNARKMPEGERPLTASDCYRFVLSQPKVNLCMMGPRNGEQLAEGLKALELGPLSDEEMIRVRRIGAHIYGKKETPSS